MDILMPLAPPILLSAAVIYASCHVLVNRWRRARGYLPVGVYPGSAEQTVDQLRVRVISLEDAKAEALAEQDRLRAEEAVLEQADLIVFEERLRLSKP